MDSKIVEFIEIEALLNAKKFKGKANPKAIIGRLISQFPQVKKDFMGTQKKLNEIVSKINEMDISTQEKLLLSKDIKIDEKELEKELEKKSSNLKTLILDFDQIFIDIESYYGKIYLSFIKNSKLDSINKKTKIRKMKSFLDLEVKKSEEYKSLLEYEKKNDFEIQMMQNKITFLKKMSEDYNLIFITKSDEKMVEKVLKKNEINKFEILQLTEDKEIIKLNKICEIEKSILVTFQKNYFRYLLDSNLKSIYYEIHANEYENKDLSNINTKNILYKVKNIFELEKCIDVIKQIFDFTKLENELPSKDYFFRFSPAPSGHLHVGHIFNILYNQLYKKKYSGKFLIRLEDTNPENISLSNYEDIIEDIKWITNNDIDSIYIQSQRMLIYFNMIEKLINMEKVYACDCSSEIFKNFNDNSNPCPHRDNGVKKNLSKFNLMKKNKVKNFVLRYKADLKNKNPALRDFTIARNKSEEHVKTKFKYSLWPMYNLCCAIDDSLMGLTHIIRGKDGEINAIKQDMIKDDLKLQKSDYVHIGRVQFTDIKLSKSQFTKDIADKKYESWEDQRIPTIASFRKKGYLPQAFFNFILSKGISKRDSKITYKDFLKTITYHNKQLLEIKSNRCFSVFDSKILSIKNFKELEKEISKIKILKHPDFESKGYREFKVEKDYLIDNNDFENLFEKDIFRLMHFANFKVLKKDDVKIEVEFISKEFDKDLKLKKNMQYVSKKNNMKVVLINLENKKINGEMEITKLEKNNPYQFERVGFVKFEKVEKKKNIFYLTHR